MRVKHGQGLFWLLQEEIGEAVRSRELANFNNFNELPRVGADPSCLVPGRGVIKMVEYWP